MDQITRTVRIALAVCLPGALAIAPAAAQQAAVPQAYPQTQGYSADAAPSVPTTYPTTPQSAPARVPGAQPLIVRQQGLAPQGVPQQSANQQQPVAPIMPPGFPLNALQQAAIDQVLDAWQNESANITTYSCNFERWEFVLAFSPRINGDVAPLNKNHGELTYSKPDKGSFQITKIFTYTELPAPADQPQAPKRGDWIEQTNAIGEHWACDGKSVYEFRADRKQVIERPLPPHAPGETILDGPLPFLFGAEAKKLKEKYWIRIDDRINNPAQINLVAWPKTREQSGNFSQVDVILNRQLLLPEAMRVTLPNKDWHVYIFKLDTAKKNAVLSRIQQALFSRPIVPGGWQHVVENLPVAEAPQPATDGQKK